MKIYGLTGGTGSGKSAAAARFATHGVAVIDADKVGHAVIAPGGMAEAAVREAFGDAVLSEGGIDRVKLGARVFGDREALARLNALVHPAIFAEIGRQCVAHAEAGRPAVLIDAALLAEGGKREPFLDGLVLVLAPRATRLQRLVTSRGIPAEQAARQLDAQTPPEAKRPLADWVIENDGTLEVLHNRVDAIAGEWLDGTAQ
jgi:dephospho-CoA kinase